MEFKCCHIDMIANLLLNKKKKLDLDMGRNFFKNENPVGMIKAVRGIIYDDLTEKEAMEVYNTTKSAKVE